MRGGALAQAGEVSDVIWRTISREDFGRYDDVHKTRVLGMTACKFSHHALGFCSS